VDEELPRGYADDRGLNRLLAFSDGVFAIAITLLILTIDIPEVPPADPDKLGSFLRILAPEFLSFCISFAVVGLYWISHHRKFRYIKRYDEGLLWLNLLFLFAVVILPFPTEVIGDYSDQPAAMVLYGGSLAFAGFCAAGLWWYAAGSFRLVDRTDLSEHEVRSSLLYSLAPAFIFLASAGIAFVHVGLAQFLWFLPLPIYIGIELSRHRARKRLDAERRATRGQATRPG